MLLELAIGDAYGAGFEYAPDSVVRRHNDLSRYIPHDRHGLQPGRYTDETEFLTLHHQTLFPLKYAAKSQLFS